MTESGPSPLGLDEARRRLRELGYLDARVERFLFARVFSGRSGGIFVPAVLAGAFAAAAASVCAVLTAEPDFVRAAAGPAVLMLHLFAAFLLPCSALAALVAWIADRSSTPSVGATVCAVLATAAILALWIAGAYGLTRGLPGASPRWGIVAAFFALTAAETLRASFLARAYAHSQVLPRSRRRFNLAFVALAGLVVAGAIFRTRPEPSVPPALHVSPRTQPLLVVAIDGVSGPSTETGALGTLLASTASGWWPREAGTPPELWTTVATGVPASRHGVRALERVRPAGSPSAVRPPFGTRWYLRGLGPALSLVSSAPVSAADRRALAFWEVSASAGLSTSVVGWWASGPWPGAAVIDNRDILARARDGEEADAAVLGELTRRRGDAVEALYLPGPDILRREPARRMRELDRIAAFLAGPAARARAGGPVLAVLTADSHGAPGSLAHLFVFDGGDRVSSVRIRAVDVAPSLLARAGIPAAADLAGRPVPSLFAEGSLETLTVPTYGPRQAPVSGRPATSDRDYLKKLRSLGYLQ